MTEALRRAEMVAVGSALSRRGLIGGREGNLSCRLEDGVILVTPRGAYKGRMSCSDMVRCAPFQPPPPGASSEAKAHLEVYRRCPEVRALIHAHPPAVLALSALGRVPSPDILLEGKALVPRIELVPAITAGSSELADACGRAIQLAPAAILLEHGALCAGEDLWQALDRVEVLELLASIDLAGAGSVVPI